VALGFAGANVTTPHKRAVAQLVDADVESVNTLVVRDGRLSGSSTDAAVLSAATFDRAAILGDGGAAAAFAAVLPGAARFSRRRIARAGARRDRERSTCGPRARPRRDRRRLAATAGGLRPQSAPAHRIRHGGGPRGPAPRPHARNSACARRAQPRSRELEVGN